MVLKITTNPSIFIQVFVNIVIENDGGSGGSGGAPTKSWPR